MWRGEVPDCLHQNHVFAVRTDPKRLLPEYLVALLASSHGRAYFETTAKKTTNLASTNSTTLGNLPLFLPSAETQERILRWILDETSELTLARSRAEREIDLLRQYSRRLIADVVTGKLDVREAAAALPDEDENLATPLDDELAEDAGDAAEFDVEEAMDEEVGE
jgi:type I restriction enzyme S subunit